MNPKRADELEGARLAFVQGGDKGFRLVHVTPPISVRRVADNLCEACWSPPEMPLTYATAPVVVDNDGRSDITLLAEMTRRVMRPTAVSRFSSAFRSRRDAVAGEVGAHVLSVYEQFRLVSEVAKTYVQAMPYAPPKIEQDRVARYQNLLAQKRGADSSQ